MADGLEITSGGAIAVDSESIRDVSRRIGAVARTLTDAAHAVRRGGDLLAQAPSGQAEINLIAIGASADRIAALADEADDHVARTALMADVFELVELRAEQSALSLSGVVGEGPAIRTRIEELIASDPRVERIADRLVDDWRERRFDGLEGQFLDGLLPLAHGPLSDPAGGALGAVGLAAANLGAGVLRTGARLYGDPPAVRVTPVSRTTVRLTASTPPTERSAGAVVPPAVPAAAPPRGLADSVGRIPYGSEGQVRVERYTMADGGRRFIAYVDGTREQFSFGGDEPWDMASNKDMYLDREVGASHRATLVALEQAGARPGDRVDLVAYSQGGMVASHVAMSGPYETGVTIIAGSPVEPTLAEDQLLVQLRHTDDPVAALAGGGSIGGTGAPDGFTAWRETGEARSATPFAPHAFETYLETAGRVDASGDPRLDRLAARWRELDDAVEVEITEYRAERE